MVGTLKVYLRTIADPRSFGRWQCRLCSLRFPHMRHVTLRRVRYPVLEVSLDGEGWIKIFDQGSQNSKSSFGTDTHLWLY